MGVFDQYNANLQSANQQGQSLANNPQMAMQALGASGMQGQAPGGTSLNTGGTGGSQAAEGLYNAMKPAAMTPYASQPMGGPMSISPEAGGGAAPAMGGLDEIASAFV